MPGLRRKLPIAEFRLKALKPYALQYELEPDGDYARPGNSPPARAFQVLNSGFDLALEIARSGFPSEDSRTQKRGGRWMIENVMFRSAPEGVKLLAVGMPTVLARTGGDLDGAIEGPTATAVRHEQLRAAVADFFPLDKIFSPFLEASLEEYNVMETKEPRPGVANGFEQGSGYSQALMRGEDPDQDPALVAEQRRWARDFFITEMTFYACQAMLDVDFSKLRGGMARMANTGDPKDEYRERLLAAWVRGSQVYRDYALLDEEA